MAVIEVSQDVGVKSPLSINEFYEKYASELGLKIVAGNEGLLRCITSAELERPGLSLAGCCQGSAQKILIFGRAEMDYIKTVPTFKRHAILKAILFETTPLVLISRNLRVPNEIVEECEEKRYLSCTRI